MIGLEKAMAPHSSTLAWKIPWTEEPGRLQSMGSKRRNALESETREVKRILEMMKNFICRMIALKQPRQEPIPSEHDNK